MSTTGKSAVLVTGASTGIGEAVARHLCGEGHPAYAGKLSRM